MDISGGVGQWIYVHLSHIKSFNYYFFLIQIFCWNCKELMMLQ